MYLFEIQRGEIIISAPGNDVKIASGDLLYFSGQVGNFGELFDFDGVHILDENHVNKLFVKKKGKTILGKKKKKKFKKKKKKI